MVLDIPQSQRSVNAASVVGVALPGALCERNSDSADRACTVARLGVAVCASSGLPGGTCADMVGGVIAMFTAVAPALPPWVPLAACASVCGGGCGRSSRRCGAVVGLPLREGFTDGSDIGIAVR